MSISRRTFLSGSAALAATGWMNDSPHALLGATETANTPRRGLGMYVHTHWSYNHPYCARTWTEEDWHGYLRGLAHLGYDTVMFWPLLDCMPAEPTPSDAAFLVKIGRVIRFAQSEMGLRFIVVACPNTIGNAKAPQYVFEKRPYFVCEHKVNPKNRADVRAFLDGRRAQFEPIAHANALAIIDSDPGGYIGSTNEEFVDLMAGQLEVFRSFNRQAELYYWMLDGWENYNRFWAEAQRQTAGGPPPVLRIELPAFEQTLSAMKRKIAEPWGVLASSAEHVKATDELGLADKRLFFPYGIVEGEPSFPLTNFDPKACATVMQYLKGSRYPRGFMANAQTHALQLPNTFFIAEAFRNGANPPDLAGFGESVLPGMGAALATAWEAIGAADASAQREASVKLRERLTTDPDKLRATGSCSGLLFGDPKRFVNDLADNLLLRAATSDLASASAAGKDPRPTLRAMLNILRPYQQRVGFNDACGGPLTGTLNGVLAGLHDPTIDRILARVSEWKDLPARHGVMVPLLDAAQSYCDRGGR